MPQMSFILMFLVMRFSASEEVKKNLTGTVGGNITLPAPVQERGYLSYGRTIIADVKGGIFDIEEIYKNRLQWDRNSGLFTLTELQRNDSGIYTVDSKTGKVFTSSYKLTVYAFVPSVSSSAPSTDSDAMSVSSESCSLLCLVDRETTLLWFKDEQMLNQSSSALSLPLTVHKQDFSSSYRCVAANPAENKTLPVHSSIYCELIAVVIVVVTVVFIAVSTAVFRAVLLLLCRAVRQCCMFVGEKCDDL
ncbi:scotin [Sarotherodon galilaeus]